ncbi:hypothetical protein ACJX0J_039740, partial [Zea mays]
MQSLDQIWMNIIQVMPFLSLLQIKNELEIRMEKKNIFFITTLGNFLTIFLGEIQICMKLQPLRVTLVLASVFLLFEGCYHNNFDCYTFGIEDGNKFGEPLKEKIDEVNENSKKNVDDLRESKEQCFSYVFYEGE